MQQEKKKYPTGEQRSTLRKMITRRGYLVEVHDRDRRALTAQPQHVATSAAGGGPPQAVICHRPYDATRSFVPPQWGRKHRGPAQESESMQASRAALHFAGSLNPKQQDAFRATVDAIRRDTGGVLCLPTGWGKTVLALRIAAEFGLKTLVVVHKQFLADQWIERIRQFLPTAKVGRIQGPVVDVQDKDIVLGMLQSVSMKEYPLHTFRGFGLLILDEAHHTPAATFSNVFFQCNCRYRLALTATPERKDGLEYLLDWFVGDIAFRAKREDAHNVRVQSVPFQCLTFRSTPPLTYRGDLNMPRMINTLCDIPERNALIVEEAKRLSAEGRHTLVLSDRREHCKALHQQIPHSALFIGGTKELVLDSKVLIATYGLVSEGFDVPTLDSVILATPRSDVVQSVGRILRETPGKKHDPEVVDICDQWAIFCGQAKKRRKFYDEAGFETKGGTTPNLFV
jgi:superfamily II DNA or RNA helicase